MNLKLKPILPITQEPEYKASLHRTGKIGLAISTADHFGIKADKAIQLLVNEDDVEDKCIYGILTKAGEQNTYKIQKGGDYHTINSKDFFDTLKIDYTRLYVVYKVSKIEVDGKEVIKFDPFKRGVVKAGSTPI